MSHSFFKHLMNDSENENAIKAYILSQWVLHFKPIRISYQLTFQRL